MNWLPRNNDNNKCSSNSSSSLHIEEYILFQISHNLLWRILSANDLENIKNRSIFFCFIISFIYLKEELFFFFFKRSFWNSLLFLFFFLSISTELALRERNVDLSSHQFLPVEHCRSIQGFFNRAQTNQRHMFLPKCSTLINIITFPNAWI